MKKETKATMLTVLVVAFIIFAPYFLGEQFSVYFGIYKSIFLIWLCGAGITCLIGFFIIFTCLIYLEITDLL